VDTEQARRWISALAAAVTERAEELTALDAPIGDSDHGVNLRRGFAAVEVALDAADLRDPGEVLVKTGTTLMSKVGGASGPLYGSAFRAMGKAVPGTAEWTAVDLSGALDAALAAIRKLGGAAPGDKTMVDAWTPAVEAFAAARAGDVATAAAAAAKAAEEGMRATIPLQARKGRASYLGERGIGHQDPGATSTWLLFRTLADTTGA
jgi:dihydroxyacetone kinase-like protein